MSIPYYQFGYGIKIKSRGSLLTKRIYLYSISGAPSHEIKNEPRMRRRMRSRRFYECESRTETVTTCGRRTETATAKKTIIKYLTFYNGLFLQLLI